MPQLLSWTSMRRRLIVCRLLACTIAGILFVLFVLSPKVSSQPTQHLADPHHGIAHAKDSTGRRGPQERDPPPQIPIREQSASALQDVDIASTKDQSSPTAPAKETADSEYLQTLAKLPTLLPDEGRINHLLSPLPASGGSTLLRELAFRTRIFRELFTAWETLHLIPSEDGRLGLRHVVRQLSSVDREVYDRFRVFINAFAQKLFPWTMPYFPDHMLFHASFYSAGRGIVFTAGTDQARYLLTSIPALRRLGCDLPIEVIYLGDDDLSEDARDSLEALEGVVTVNVEEMVDDRGWKLKGWAAKPFAILYSSFREVIFMDADALFLTNPENLFHDRQYLKTGTLFFKDRSVLPESRKLWLRSVLPKPLSHHIKTNRMWTGESGHMQDSGVVVVDKWKHFVSLLLTTRLNGPDRDGDEKAGKKGVYEMVYGDKETFWLSWELAGDLKYAFFEGGQGNMGVLRKPEERDEAFDDDDEEKDFEEDEDEDDFNDFIPKAATPTHRKPLPSAKPRICSPQLLHFDRAGKPIWFNGWLATSKSDKADYQRFEVYMRDPPRVKGEKNPWDLKGGNVVCLTGEEALEFTADEKVLLGKMLESARSNPRR